MFQHVVPPGKHALITVRQPKGNLVWIQTQTSITKKNEKEKFTPRISTWNDCDSVQVTYTLYILCLICIYRGMCAEYSKFSGRIVWEIVCHVQSNVYWWEAAQKH